MAYCVVRVNKVKTQEHFERSMDHNFRMVNVPNADPAKADLNKVLVEMKERNYLEAYYSRINKSEFYKTRKVRSDAVRALEVMLTCSGDVDKKVFDQEKWEEKNVEWLQNKFGAENVVSAIVHYDESSPHIHAIVIPMVNGSLNAKHYTDGRGTCGKLQTEYYEAMKEFGLERGLARTGAKHTDIKRFQSAITRAVSRELPLVEVGETAYDYRARVNEFHKDSHLHSMGEIEKAKKATQKAKASLAEAKTELKTANAELELLREELQRRAVLDDVVRRKAERMDEVLNGLRNGCLSESERESFENTMSFIYLEGLAKKPEEMSVEKKALLMDELLAGIKGGSLPFEERKAFNSTMRQVAEWESEREKVENENDEVRENVGENEW